jgi:hypothetical protein
MTHRELEEMVADLVTQLSTQGFENPISFAAIERTGRTSTSPPQEKLRATSRPPPSPAAK